MAPLITGVFTQERRFGYDQQILEAFPSVRAGVIEASGLANGSSPAELVAEYLAEQQSVRERMQTTPISDLPSISAWRRAFTKFGAKPTQHRSAVESLLRRLTKQGDIPSINTLVDIGNLISIRYKLPVAAVDLSGIAGFITVCISDGTESFTDLGFEESVNPEPGEVVFVDRDRVASSRRWCWRQSQQSATTASTTEAMFVIEGHHADAASDIAAAIADLAGLLGKYQPQGQTATYFLDGAA
ncbi:MAG: B3/B4 domain-containing protein [Acidimicrobiia bacterium]